MLFSIWTIYSFWRSARIYNKNIFYSNLMFREIRLFKLPMCSLMCIVPYLPNALFLFHEIIMKLFIYLTNKKVQSFQGDISKGYQNNMYLQRNVCYVKSTSSEESDSKLPSSYIKFFTPTAPNLLDL